MKDGLCTMSQLCEATGGRLLQGDGEHWIDSVFTDSRQVDPRGLFVALRGDRFDGAAFCAQAVSDGARAVMVEQASVDDGKLGELPSKIPVAVVPDAEAALGDLAAWHRARFSVRLVGITGSNGKTTTKEMTAAVLGGEPEVLFNRGNFNNLIGMPRGLLRLRESHRHAVMEMGMNAPGEIARLAQIAAPQVGLVTNVHPVHLQGLGGIQAVADAKGELIEALPGTGVAVLNADDPYALMLASRTRARKVTFGNNPAADVRVSDLAQAEDGLRFNLEMAGRTQAVHLPRLGLHNASNAAAAAAVGLVENLEPEVIAHRLAEAPQPPMRMEERQVGTWHLLVDCYNANPRSVQAALATLGQLPGRGPKLAVLGDMLELGDSAEAMHEQTGTTVAGLKLDGLVAFGPLSQSMARAARNDGLEQVLETEDVQETVDWLRARLDDDAWVLIKGSRGMRLERVVAALEEGS